MKKILLLQLDGKWPNHALMRASSFHKGRGDQVVLRRVVSVRGIEALAVRFEGNDSFFDGFDIVYASLIFAKTGPLAERLLSLRSDAVVGGSGWDDYPAPKTRLTSLEEHGIFTDEKDYTLYPNFTASLGYTQRGCRMNEKVCWFCGVPGREGKVRAVSTVAQLWRGEPHPKHLLLFDNDFFGQPGWRSLVAEMREGDFKVCFNQGINARMLNDETAAAIASLKYVDDDFSTRRIYTAWDGSPDEHVLMRGLEALKRAGVRPDDMMVYMLISDSHGQTFEDWEYRRARLRAFGARPYPMPFERTSEQIGFQRWVLGAYDKEKTVKHTPWPAWVRAKYQPRNLGDRFAPSLFDA